MYGKDLRWVLMILVYNRISRQVADAHDAVCVVHAILFNGINRGVYMPAAAVVVGSVHMNTQRFAAHLPGMYACREHG